MNITSETIKSAMAKTLALQYPEVTLYKNKVLKGFKKPCFFISQLEPSIEKIGKNRYKINFPMCIRYHNDNASRTDLDSVGFNIMDIFDTLIDGEPICYAKNSRYEILDDVLQCFITYSINVIKPVKENIKMENLDFKEGLK